MRSGRRSMEAVWEECSQWGTKGSWEEMYKVMLREDEERKEWLRELEKVREGRGESGLSEYMKSVRGRTRE